MCLPMMSLLKPSYQEKFYFARIWIIKITGGSSTKYLKITTEPYAIISSRSDQGSVIGEKVLREPQSLSGQMTHSHGHLVWLCPHRICWGQSIDVNIYPVTKYEKAEGCEDPHIIFGVGGGGVGGRERYFRWSDVTVSVCVTMYDFFLRQPCKYFPEF